VSDESKEELSGLRKRLHDVANIAQTLVTRDATMAVQVSHLVELSTEHKTDFRTFTGDTRETLSGISEQVTKTNGRVNGHDDHFAVNDREIRDIKETLSKVMWLIFGLFATGIAGVVMDWVTRR